MITACDDAPSSLPPTGGMETQTSVHPAGEAEALKPRIIGTMRNVLWKNELFARIDFDTLQNRAHLYALGPLENLTGEFAIIDGHAWVVRVVNEQPAELLGFYSREHKGVFTHHDSYTHIHLLSNDKIHLGHLDTLLLSEHSNLLYLPTHVNLNRKL